MSICLVTLLWLGNRGRYPRNNTLLSDKRNCLLREFFFTIIIYVEYIDVNRCELF